MNFDPFGSFSAVMCADSLIQTLRQPDVKRVGGSAKDVEEAHQEMMITHEALRLARARSGPFDSASKVSFFLFNGCAKRSHERGRWPSRMAIPGYRPREARYRCRHERRVR
jgi:hypothetical protein